MVKWSPIDMNPEGPFVRNHGFVRLQSGSVLGEKMSEVTYQHIQERTRFPEVSWPQESKDPPTTFFGQSGVGFRSRQRGQQVPVPQPLPEVWPTWRDMGALLSFQKETRRLT